MNWMYSQKRKEMLNRTFVVWPLRNTAERCFEEYGVNKTMHCHRKGSLGGGSGNSRLDRLYWKNRESLEMCKGVLKRQMQCIERWRDRTFPQPISFPAEHLPYEQLHQFHFHLIRLRQQFVYFQSLKDNLLKRGIYGQD